MPDPDGATSAEHLVVVTFPEAAQAEAFLLAATSAAGRIDLRLFDVVFITRSDHGKVHVHETGDISTTKGTAESGFWGLVVGTLLLGPVGGLAAGALTAGTGALLATFIDTGISDGFIRDLKQQVQPGYTALVLLTDDLGPATLAAELGPYPAATIASSPFTADAHHAARAAHHRDGSHPAVETSSTRP